MFRLLTILSIFVAATVHADDCSHNLECGKCTSQSEFAWNPANSFINEDLAHFYRLPALLEKEYHKGNLNKASKHAKQYLNLATAYHCNWNHGNAIHDANRYLGLISLKKKDIDNAVMYLQHASETPGSMQLETFGPEFDLARHLLKEGKRDEVIQYLVKIDAIWKNNQQIHKWISKIEAGKTPLLERYSQTRLHQLYATGYSY